jgi:peptidoglycan/LPS O-acetylase OafA/YrhL
MSKETENNQHHRTLSYRPELDGLRAVAVLSVLFYHAGFGLFRGGFVGVDIFFVLSGYLMTSIILKETELNAFTLKRFYERRALRILPMLTPILVVSYFPAFNLMVEKELFFFTKSAFFSSISIANIFYSSTTKGYFDTSTDFIPLVHTWTLGVEEQFYVIIPLVFMLFWRFGKYSVFGVILALALASFYLTFAQINTIHKFYMLYTRFWELSIGSLIVLLPKQNKSDKLAFAGLAFILTAIFGFTEKLPNPSYYTLLPTVGTAFIILYLNHETGIGAILSGKNLVFIGLVSYSAYLIHQPKSD